SPTSTHFVYTSLFRSVIAVDEDIDPDNLDAVFWAMGYRSNPLKDVQIMPNIDIGHAPRHDERGSGAEDSSLLWDATLKGTFPPRSEEHTSELQSRQNL